MRGVIAAGSVESAAAGARIFREGGNAVDAAVAAAFASFVTEMMVVNLGGGGYAVVADDQGAHAYDFFTGVPQRGDAARYDFRRIEINFGPAVQPFFIGRASSAVPGVMAGLTRLAGERGTLPLAQLMAPAIDFAREGFCVSEQFAHVVHLLTPIFCDTPELQAMVGVDGRLCRAGDHLRFPRLAATLTQLAHHGPDWFYTGAPAQAIAADHAQHGGRITARDMAEYRVHKTAPLRVSYRGYEVLLPPPSSLGGSLIGFSLKLLEDLSPGDHPHNGARHVDILAQVMRATNRARADWDDVDEAERALGGFFSEARLAPYRTAIADALAGGPLTPEAPEPPKGAGNTSHISAMDRHGQAVGITTTAGENAGYLIGDTGLCLNNILGELDLNPHGFHVQTPGDRMNSMMAPIVVLRDGEPVVTLGSAGSNRLRSAIIQTLSNIVDFHMTPHRAANAARVHHEDGTLHLEGGIAPDVAQALAARGFRINAWAERNLYFGGAQVVGKVDGPAAGGADARRGAAVMTVGDQD